MLLSRFATFHSSIYIHSTRFTFHLHAQSYLLATRLISPRSSQFIPYYPSTCVSYYNNVPRTHGSRETPRRPNARRAVSSLRISARTMRGADASAPAAGGDVAVVVIGQLRWFPITLASLRHFLLLQLPAPHRWRGFFVGPAGSPSVRSLLASHLVTDPANACEYAADVEWRWAGASMPFEMHPRDVCLQQPQRRQLAFNADRVPTFGVCWNAGANQREVFLPKPGARSLLCSQAVSLIMQMWQSAQAVDLIKGAERRSGGALWHGRVVRVRADLAFLHPVHLPRSPSSRPWFSFLDGSCAGVKNATHVGLYRPRRPGESVKPSEHTSRRFVPDLILIGSRSTLDIALREPIRILIANATEYEDPRQQGLPHPGGSYYYAHPLPHALLKHFDASACVDASNTIGLLRINSEKNCWNVQLRLQKRQRGRAHRRSRGGDGALSGRVWRTISVTEPVDRWLSGHDLTILKSANRNSDLFLIKLAELYARCVGLQSNASCPRVVGDRQLVAAGGSSLATNCRMPMNLAAARVRKAYSAAASSALLSASCHGADELPKGTENEQPDDAAVYACVDAGLAALVGKLP